MTANPITTAQADMLRTAVLAKIAYWDALLAVEIELGVDLTDAQDCVLCAAIEDLAVAAPSAEAITIEDAQTVFDAVRKVKHGPVVIRHSVETAERAQGAATLALYKGARPSNPEDADEAQCIGRSPRTD